MPDSAAAKAGIEQYDVIIAVDGEPVHDPQQFSEAIRGHKPGEQVNLELIREGKRRTLSLDLTGTPEPPAPLRRLPPDTFLLPPWQPGQRPAPYRYFEVPVQPRHDGDFALTWKHDNQELTLTQKDGHRTLEIHNPSGNLVFHGPVDTQKQRDALPPDVREQLDALSLPKETNGHKPATTREPRGDDQAGQEQSPREKE